MMNTALTQIRLEYDGNLPGALVLYNSSFNIGVMGIVAAKIKDLTGLTTVIMADSPNDELLVGSVRAVDGYHVCDALKRINQEHPEIFKAFGGHKGAAGLTIRREYLNFFKEQFILASLWLSCLWWNSGDQGQKRMFIIIFMRKMWELWVEISFSLTKS